jgi:hypothetical protein
MVADHPCAPSTAHRALWVVFRRGPACKWGCHLLAGSFPGGEYDTADRAQAALLEFAVLCLHWTLHPAPIALPDATPTPEPDPAPQPPEPADPYHVADVGNLGAQRVLDILRAADGRGYAPALSVGSLLIFRRR